MIIAIVNAKGGSGKSTVAVMLAAALRAANQQARIIDLDPQGSAKEWVSSGNVGEITVGERIEDVWEGFTLVDTPPRLDSPEVAQAVRRADRILLVSSPSPGDVLVTRRTAELIKRLGAKSKTKVLFNQVQRGTILARDLPRMADHVGLPMLTAFICQRQAYQHAVLLGWRSLSSDIRAEIVSVTLEATSAKW
jgi:chromosome partitioning protein